MIILVDQDGVLADFDKYFISKWSEVYPDITLPNISDRKTFYIDEAVPQELQDMVKVLPRQQGFFENLPPIDGAIDGINKLKSLGHEIFICTSPLWYYQHCVKEKYMWIEKHLGIEWVQHAILTRDKTVVRGDFLIDDKPEIKGAHAPTWEQIIFDQAYNREIKDKRRMTWKLLEQVDDIFTKVE